ncbi:hypothetical protein [Tenacibaculum sp. 47A_GOM-205m]|uniref:hypothetical protein n=1 Tax=Tenacibaculum sp. 47A_GOM-205m TaxID=1380384 RepID=UPI00048B2D57|nr:hypothetical protein [Tenacibaculum sp. 47A_GOM-205m]
MSNNIVLLRDLMDSYNELLAITTAHYKVSVSKAAIDNPGRIAVEKAIEKAIRIKKSVAVTTDRNINH